MGKGRRLAQHVPARTAWPIQQVWEPMSGDFGILQPPTNSTILAYEDDFLRLYKAGIHDGNFAKADWNEWCDHTGIPSRLWHETSGLVAAQSLIPLAVLSDLCEDLIPHIGAFLDDFIWGGLNGSMVLGGAIASTMPLLKHGQSVLAKTADNRPKLSPLCYHHSLTAHHRTPTMIWQRSGNHVVPLLPLAQQYHPTYIEDSTLLPELFIAKILCVNEMWMPHFILPVEEIAAVEVVRARLILAWFRYRRHSHKICFEDILRERSDLIYRTVVEFNR